MIRYEIICKSEELTTSMYEILVWYNNEKVGCIYYLEDQLKATETAEFDEWRHLWMHRDQIKHIYTNKLAIAQQVILEYYLLETESIIM